MASEEVTLSAVEKFIAEKHRTLEFPAWLEKQFDEDTRGRRAQRRQRATAAKVIVYNLFLIPDWFIIPDQFKLAVLLHVFVVTPWIVFSGWLAGRNKLPTLQDGVAASVPVVITMQILVGFVLTSSPEVGHYQTFVLLVVMFANTVQRLPFRYAATASIGIVALHATTVAISGQMSTVSAVLAIMNLNAAAYLTLLSNYYLERDVRRTYLIGLRERLRHAQTEVTAERDALTELGNRHYLAKKIEELWDGSDRQLSAIMLDIDHFKLFNDRYGHVVGDLCVKRVGACITAELRMDCDAAIRYGGEELLVLLPNTDMTTGMQVAERIRRRIEALAIPQEGLGPRRVVTASAGVAAAPVATVTANELIAAADAALYAAKRNGRNQVWPPLMKETADNTGSIVNLPKRA